MRSTRRIPTLGEPPGAWDHSFLRKPAHLSVVEAARVQDRGSACGTAGSRAGATRSMSQAPTATKSAWPGKSAHTLMTVQVLDRKTRSWIGNAVTDSLVTYPGTRNLSSSYTSTQPRCCHAHLTDPHHNSWDRHQQHDESYNPDREPHLLHVLSLRRIADEDIDHHRSALGRRIRGRLGTLRRGPHTDAGHSPGERTPADHRLFGYGRSKDFPRWLGHQNCVNTVVGPVQETTTHLTRQGR